MSAPSTLPAQLPIVPFTKPVSGSVEIPGSKSLTNRALLLAALCDSPVILTGALFSDDTRLMCEALRKLGLTVLADEAAHTLSVAGQTNAFKSADPTGVDIFVGLAGTAARFLTALCAAAPRGVYRIQGTERMNQRPMKGLIDALRALGAEIRCTGVEGFFPIEIHARSLRGGPVAIDATESSQMLSALLMVAPLAERPVEVTAVGGVRWPFVNMTALMMQACQTGPGAAVERLSEYSFRILQNPYSRPSGVLAIEPDATAASYFAALPLVVDGRTKLANLHLGLQGDTAFLDVLRRVGASVDATSGGFEVSFASGAPRVGVTENFNEFSDTFLTLAAIAPLLSGPTTITGVAHSRKQETDRVAGMVRELRKLGQHVDEHADGDGLTITPDIAALRAARGSVIETYHDHRFAMSFGILGCHDLHGDGSSWLTIDNPACCAKTFPNFFDVLASLRNRTSA
jgi:3-phosphoshikimate 1-carboxyvinyltransferase